LCACASRAGRRDAAEVSGVPAFVPEAGSGGYGRAVVTAAGSELVDSVIEAPLRLDAFLTPVRTSATTSPAPSSAGQLPVLSTTVAVVPLLDETPPQPWPIVTSVTATSSAGGMPVPAGSFTVIVESELVDVTSALAVRNVNEYVTPDAPAVRELSCTMSSETDALAVSV
jgi:hypothetical protein